MLRNEYMHYFPICFCLLFLTLIGLVAVNGDLKKEFYIVFLNDRPLEEESLFQSHIDVLSALKGSHADAKESHVYSYTKIFNAFAAKLSGDEAKKLSSMDEVHAVFKNQYRKLHTTRSWDFLGFPQTVRRNLKMERDIIIGVLDSGITPNSESFKDDGLGPPPVRWKGSCGPFVHFLGCNNKLIGAKYFKADQELFPGEIFSPVDVSGHGTHVSSTAVGRLVANASVYGLGRGTARGAMPSARLAMYKVCWGANILCADMDILAGVEAAISDGVDILSMSLGGQSQDFLDVVGVASFFAMRAGVITVAAAGNDGPTAGTVANHAPWILTVASTGIDRQFRSKVVLGNGKTTSGRGVNAFNPKRKMYPLVMGADAAKTSSSKLNASYCIENSIDPVKVKGKLVLCKLVSGLPDSYIKSIGGIGTIINTDYNISLITDPIYMAPATTVNSTEAEPIRDYYLHSVRSPSAVIYKSQEVKIPAPFMSVFSSRGPSPASEYILKPDIAAPGDGILAAYTPLATLTKRKGDTQHSKFSFISGTSMACPHVSGVAAYVKSFHPDWPSAVIKSAIMTTATPLSPRVDSDAEFGYGAGQMNPTKAVNPGLVYNIDSIEDYIPFLCREGYSGSILALLFSYNVNCSDYPPPTSHDALNYPTMQLHLKNTQRPTTVVFQRTVTNVGPSPSIYNATITAPKGVEITVKPMSLSFSTAIQEQNFKVVVKAKPMSKGVKIISASLSWRSARHVVRSPIVIYQ
ncbi:subtilisin-like protease SBT4.14 [Cornus florida]|uniref:subtilisin-like protease SBT4.14 n=1 Tax=Cornus florida TaxID=4283 RepID=UPI00289F1F44|nr:subtilisin-like protease SBT4.14 [Cornus florida]XP_059634068.1 subtilisin-like protease SBT4.14 [Cornus florida]XP_059634069.1 subtilisin-like protease SBT4.14 [Cornus florida]